MKQKKKTLKRVSLSEQNMRKNISFSHFTITLVAKHKKIAFIFSFSIMFEV